VSTIELLLHSRLTKDALSSMLTEAGFNIGYEPGQPKNNTIVLIDFADCKDPERIDTHQSRGTKIVALTSGADVREIGLEEIASLSGILTYDLSADAFVRSLHLISAGERVFPSGLGLDIRPQAPSAGTEPGRGGSQLSPREREILSHLVTGHSNKAIARDLGITEATVKVHLKSVQRKIRVDNRTQAAIWAMANLPGLDPSPRGFG
jgi:two-component system, NarL family, nitrate/nitrite response regulator NarL